MKKTKNEVIHNSEKLVTATGVGARQCAETFSKQIINRHFVKIRESNNHVQAGWLFPTLNIADCLTVAVNGIPNVFQSEIPFPSEFADLNSQRRLEKISKIINNPPRRLQNEDV